jgi:ABC-2 type transport system permease protein
MIGHLAARELRSLFLSPLAWTVLAVEQLILALVFLYLLGQYQDLQPQFSMLENQVGITEFLVPSLFGFAAMVMLLVTPLLTMRLISEERRAGTLPLLLSAPVSLSEIVLGKYLGVLGFIGLMVLLLSLMPLSLLMGGTLDFGLLASAVTGILLMLAAFSAGGLYLSTITRQPALAAIGGFFLLLFFWIIEIAGSGVSPGETTLFTYFSLQRHYHAFLRGIFDTSDVIYFGLFILVFLVLSIRRLDADRLQH